MTLKQIGRYQIKELLGAGAMGRVYRAHDPVLSRDVALKLLSLPRQADDAEIRRRFRREVRAASQLNHRHIVTVYDVDLDYEPPYVVMELLMGGTLKEHLQSSQLSWSEAVQLLQPLCHALSHAHRAGVIHRDVKPANVLFANDEAHTLKLVDFGLARWPEAAKVTRTGGIVGTPAYMSPEQANGEQVDNRTDIYALGLVLFEMIAGFNPQERKSTGQTWATAVSYEPIVLTPLTGKAPPQLISVLERALAKEREQRYDDVQLLWQDLAACLDQPGSEPVAAPPIQKNAMWSIQNSLGIPLPAEAEAILQKLFAAHQKVVILAEMGGGFGGGRIIKVRPIKKDGRQQLPAIVKMGPKPLIEQEWAAYTDHIHNSLARVAEIQNLPVFTETWGGLRYRLVGGGVFDSESLLNYCQDTRNSIEDVRHVLEKQLFKVTGRWWREFTHKPAFHLGASYDPLLPVNFIIRPVASTEAAAQIIRPSTNPTLQRGDIVRLEGFRVTEIDDSARVITLDRPPANDALPSSYRVRIQPVADIETYRVGQALEPVVGEVVQTRHDLLLAEAQSAVGTGVDLADDSLTLGNGIALPNPLRQLTAVLAQTFDVYIASIHGDFNVENILVDPESRTTNLIDFADARRDHALHDLLRLETGIITRLLPEMLAEGDSLAETVYRFYEQMHCAMLNQAGAFFPHSQNGQALELEALAKPFAIIKAIRKAAHNLLFDKSDWAEYYHGLTLYLLGALKFKNLDGLAKQVAFWGAAAAQKLVADPPPCPKARLFSACRERVVVSILLTAVLILGGLFAWRYVRPDQPRGEPLAVMMQFNPEVAVQRDNSDRLQDAAFALALFRDDVVITYENAVAVVGCQNGLLFQIPAENNMTIVCEETDDPRLIAQLEPQLIDAAATTSITLAADETRSPRSAETAVPRLLSPRNTFIAETRPTFTWQPVAGVSGYRLSVSLPDGSAWSRETMDVSLPYPADAPSLEPGSVNIVTLVTLDDGHTADKSLLRVLDEAASAALAERETAVRDLGLDAASAAYLLAQLYQRENLLSPAIAQLETLAQGETPLAASVWQQLGDLYFAAKLYALAEENYRMALVTAVTADDLSAQAAANVGLGRTAHAFRETEPALDYLETAVTLYRQAGEDELADLAAVERDKLGP